MVRSSQRIGPGSIKEALDDLDSGICFALPSGRIILINHQMAEISAVLTGTYPQAVSQITDALEDLPVSGGIRKLDADNLLFEFPDGRVWSFEISVLKGPELQGLKRLRALDMTAVYRAGLELEKENQALREVNAELQQMLERLADRIREKESLELKMRIHNEIGTSLIALSELLGSGEEDAAGTQLAKLTEAVGYLGVDTGGISLESVSEQAKALGISVHLDGKPPQTEPASRIFYSAASECINNCARHAGGTEIYITVYDNGGSNAAEGFGPMSSSGGSTSKYPVRFSFKNNGSRPTGPIREGGGLSSLRRLTEDAGGRMTVLWDPEFELIIELCTEL